MRSLLPTLCLFPAALFSASLAAQQATIAIQSATPISLFTSDSVGTTTFETVAAGTTIGYWPNGVSFSSSQYPNGKSFFATTSIYPTQPSYGGIGLNYFARAGCRGVAGDFAGTSNSANAAGATAGSHAVLATISAPPGTIGEFSISHLVNPGNNGIATASVDIDNDGSIEWSGGSTTIPYTFGASGQVTVRIDNRSWSPGVGTATYNSTFSDVSFWFFPDQTATCTITNYGQGCSGVQASATEIVAGTTRNLIALATGCFPSNPVIVASGSQQLGLPLLGGCSLLCTAETLEIITADAAGNATKSWSIPTTATGVTYLQMLPIDLQNGSLVLTASNGVRIGCQ